MASIPVYELNLPEYSVASEPDHAAIGMPVDALLKEHFLGQHIAVRCIASEEHRGRSLEEVVEMIRTTGWDRYDPDRVGDRYENNEGKPIDFFAFDYQVSEDSKIFKEFSWAYYHLDWREPHRPLRIDIVLIYDPAHLEQVCFTYKGREDEGERSDGWVFKNPEKKQEALLGIIAITS